MMFPRYFVFASRNPFPNTNELESANILISIFFSIRPKISENITYRRQHSKIPELHFRNFSDETKTEFLFREYAAHLLKTLT